jgi:hypothetical protein
MQLPSFAALEQRLNSAATQRLSNAMLQLAVGGPAWACIHEVTLPQDSPFADVHSKSAHSVSIWLPQVGSALLEGAVVYLTTARWPKGQSCRIVTDVDIDATGWASFDISPIF